MGIEKTTKVAALSTASALVLAGCGAEIFATDGACGSIVLVDEYPDLIVPDPFDASGDVARFVADLGWSFDAAPENAYIYSAAFQSFPGGSYLDVIFSDSPNDLLSDSLRPGEKLVFAAEGLNYTEVSGSASDQFEVSFESTPIVQDVFDYLAEIEIPFVFNEVNAVQFIHSPVTIAASCDYDFANEEPPTEQSLLDGEIELLPDSTSAVAYPGYKPGLLSFDNSDTSFTIRASAGDDWKPVFATAAPWFSGMDTLLDLETVSLLDLSSDYERYWWLQMLYTFDLGVENPSIADALYSIIENDPDVATLTEPLDGLLGTDFYYQSLLDVVNTDAAPGEEATLEELLAEVPLGELEYVAFYTLFEKDLGDQGLQLAYDFQFYYPSVKGGLISYEEYLAEQQDLPANPFTGPVITTVEPNQVAAGASIKLSGEKLGLVDSLEIDGVPLEMEQGETGELLAMIPAGIEPGQKDLVVGYGGAEVKVQNSLEVVAAPAALSSSVRAGTKRTGDSARIAAHNLVGAGKVQFFFNDEEIAWVRAVDGSDPKLSDHPTGAYLVRTRDLVEGKNVIEVYLNGERIRRVAYGK